MPPDRLRSIVPMFGGGTHYVETLDAILEFIASHTSTTDELETQSDVLQRTIIKRAGEQIPVAKTSLDSEYVAQRNAAIEWV